MFKSQKLQISGRQYIYSSCDCSPYCSTAAMTNTCYLQDNFAHPDVEWGPVTNDPRCGVSAIRRSVAQRRIVGGDEAGFGTFPWQAYIRIGTSR